MTENEITYQVRGAIFDVYNYLGPGLLESIYEAALIYELRCRGLQVEQQVEVPVYYKGIQLQTRMRLDLLVEKKVIIELKSTASLLDIHRKQLITYLRITRMKVGLLVNFNTTDIQNDIERFVNGL